MFGFFKSLFTKHGIIQDEKDPMKKYLIVGLGNIGDEYAETRHNIGFKVLDEVAQANDFTFETAKLGDIGSYKIKGRTIICLKPSTYMNRSGKALKYWMDKENIPQSNVLVITDDINLPFGTIRIKTKGSNGGHNGLKDIELFLQTILYNRYRFGVGADFGKGRQVEYVLGQWDDEEKALLPERLKKSTEIINSFVLAGIARTMNQYNNT
ncbi:aminoacyl-tRNA hydrolase [Maribacter arcticus]|uniref:Peptidyl-tRNA hydrolase n=1 Tax=Maribacter arcticus TaxID=561365 RepID=A0A1T5B2Z6_9FLAO|nr:aminoacyl-tRNA hydrolase [Maribacter arcticus]SKB41628.1 peptidyl-tRNA hydrolase [Maribacter arcticus]|tara:strand:- start:33 stop:662 length:630 start_codon:yes stop_codon:yes gene_type:complete